MASDLTKQFYPLNLNEQMMKKINLLFLLIIPLLGFSQSYQEETSQEVIDGEQVTVVRTTKNGKDLSQTKPMQKTKKAINLQSPNKNKSEVLKQAFQKAVQNGELTQNDISEWIVTAEHVSRTSGIHHMYLRQAFNGIEIHKANSSAHFYPNGSMFRFNQGFVKNLSQQIAGSATPAISAVEAAAIAPQKNLSGVNFWGTLIFER